MQEYSMQSYRNKAGDFVAATIDLVSGKPLVVRLGNRSDRLNKRVNDEIAALELMRPNVKAFSSACALELMLANVKAFGAAQATANAKLIDDAIVAAAAKAQEERQEASDAISAAENAKARATAVAARLSGQNTDEPDSTEG
jgi:hypothetical protein